MKKLTLFFVLAMLLIAFNVSAAKFTETLWVKTTVNSYGVKYNVWTHTSAVTVADSMCYTAVTPLGLDTSKEWEVIFNADVVTIDGATLPVWIVGGWSEDSDFGYLTDPSIDCEFSFTDMAVLKTLEADVKATIGVVSIKPDMTTADVTDTVVNLEKLPYYGFYYLGTTTFSGSVSVVTIIIQKSTGY